MDVMSWEDEDEGCDQLKDCYGRTVEYQLADFRRRLNAH